MAIRCVRLCVTIPLGQCLWDCVCDGYTSAPLLNYVCEGRIGLCCVFVLLASCIPLASVISRDADAYVISGGTPPPPVTPPGEGRRLLQGHV